MRQLSTATLAAAVALVFANAAQAATITTTSTRPTFTGQVPSASTSTTTNTTPAFTRAPNATVDLRAQQTAAATAVTHASGSISALGDLFGTDTSKSVGAFNQNVPFGSGATVAGAFFTNPADVTNGGVASETNGTTMSNSFSAASDVIGGASVLDTTLVANQAAQANAASVDRAIRVVASERRRIGRNGQLLNTIAPRTNGVDRSREMPDDPLPPSLTGSNSTLVR